LRLRLLSLPLLIASIFALVACGGGGGEEAKVEEVIETSATSTDPADCRRFQTQEFMEQVSREKGEVAVEECEEEAEKEEGAESVDVANVEVSGSSATAEAALSGGSLDGQTVEVELVKESDQWKLNEVVKLTQFSREKLMEALEGEFSEHSGEVSPKLAACFLTAFGRAKKKEVEEFLFGESATAIEILAATCTPSPSA
jgi:hypothetical protein